MDMSSTPVITTSDLTKEFKDITAIQEVNLTVHEGDVYGVLGPNGAGKTTTLSIILGLMNATHGTAQVLGKTVSTENNSALLEVGALIGDGPAYFPYFTGRQNVTHVAKRFGMPDSNVADTLKFLGIADAADRMPDLYSTGMKQRLGIAMAIVHNPKILVLDEPTNGMDPSGMREMRTLIRQLAERGITILLASHLLHEVEQVCNRVAVFNHGSIIKEGSLAEFHGASETVCIRTHETKKVAEILKNSRIVEPDMLEVTGISSEKVIETLVKHSLTPSEVYIKKNSLEELFLELVEDGK